MLKLFLRLLAILIALVTTLAGVSYAAFVVIWLHAPALKVVLVTLLLCAVPALISWGLLHAAKRIHARGPSKI